MNKRFVLLLTLALIAACERQEDQANVGIGSGNAGAGTAEESRVKIDTPAIKADIKMPLLGMMSENMDIDGAKLYPGSKITGVNIDAGAGKDGLLTMRFEAPAGQAQVTKWFGDQFAQAEFKARPTPTGFAGEKADGDWFALDLKEANGRTQGEFKMGKAAR
jgi:hypothetical protein